METQAPVGRSAAQCSQQLVAMRPMPLALCASFWIALAVSSRGGCQATGIPSTRGSSSSSSSRVIGGGGPGHGARARPLPRFAAGEADEDEPWLPLRRPLPSSRSPRLGARALLQEESEAPEAGSGRMSSALARGRQGRRRAWLAHLVAQRQEEMGLVLQDLKTQGSLGRSKLAAPISRAGLQWVPLDPDFDENYIAQNDSWPLACPARGECPDFRVCGRQQVRLPPNMLSPEEREALNMQHQVVDYTQAREVDFGGVEACRVSALSSHESVQPPPAINCPRRPCPPDECEGLVFDPACSHAMDDVLLKKWSSSVYVLRDVYVNQHGQAFNTSSFFDRSGCASFDDFSFPQGFPVVRFPVLISLVHWATSSFYHGIIELLPMFFVFAHLPKVFQAHPILIEVLTMDFLHGVGSFLLGPDISRLNFRILSEDSLVRADTLVQPLFQTCGAPSPPLWRALRRRHLVPEGGLPMFNEDWTPRETAPAPAGVGSMAHRDWAVVLVQRQGSRSLDEHEAVHALLLRLFPPSRVVVFSGNLDIADAKELFNRAVLVVAVHGAAMTNMIFMPFHATIVELRPRNYGNACFHHLAEVCDLNYFLVLCDGAFETAASCDVEKVTETMTGVMPLVQSLTTEHS